MQPLLATECRAHQNKASLLPEQTSRVTFVGEDFFFFFNFLNKCHSPLRSLNKVLCPQESRNLNDSRKIPGSGILVTTFAGPDTVS